MSDRISSSSGSGPAFIPMFVVRRGTKLRKYRQPADGQMLRKRSQGAEKKIEGILEEYGKRWNWRVGGEGWRQGLDVGLDVGPGQVDVEE